MIWDEAEDLMLEYGFNQHPGYGHNTCNIVINNVEYLFRDSNYNVYVIGSTKTHDTISIPVDDMCEYVFLASINIPSFHDLYNYIVCRIRRNTIDKILISFENESS